MIDEKARKSVDKSMAETYGIKYGEENEMKDADICQVCCGNLEGNNYYDVVDLNDHNRKLCSKECARTFTIKEQLESICYELIDLKQYAKNML